MSKTESVAQQASVTPERILQTSFGFWPAQVLLTANSLNVFSVLEESRALDADALGKRLNLHPRGSVDFFDALVALGFLERENGMYSNTAESSAFLVRDKPSFVGGILDYSTKRTYNIWGELKHSLESGEPRQRSSGDVFGEMYSDEEGLRRFLSAMTGVSMATACAMAQKFPWKNYSTFIDIGCAQGGTPVQIALGHPHLKGGGYDLPVVQPVFEEFISQNGLSDRLKFYGGDFFKEELPQAEVLIMGHILHDWDLDQKRMLLEKTYRALPKDGALIVHEALIDDDRRQNAFGLMMSLNMLVETPGGFDFTGEDCCGWMRDAGFRETRVEHLAGPDSMVVAIK